MIWFAANILSLSRSDRLVIWLVRCFAGVAGLLLVLIVGFLLAEAFPVLHHIGIRPFLMDDAWHPTEGQYNLLPMLWGSLAVTVGAVLIAGPLGVLSAMFCQFYAPPRLARWYRRSIELLAGVPSVVYGLWGLTVLVPLIGHMHPPGPSLLAGILVLAVMIFPTIALFSDMSLANVPGAYIQGAMALGLGRWTIVRDVVFPAAGSGLATGMILGTGRALGETMAVLMVCGNVPQLPRGFFDPVRTLTANIALEIAYAFGDHRSALFVSGIVLLSIVAALMLAATMIGVGGTHGD